MSPTMGVSTTRYDLLRVRLDRFTRLLHRVEGGHVRATHRTRVESRRLREVLPVLELDSRVSDKLIRRLRKVTRSLGPVRESDVLLGLIDELQQANGGQDARALAMVRDHVQHARDQERVRVGGKATVVELRRLARRLEQAAEEVRHADGGSRSRAWRWAIDARVARRALTLRNAIGKAGAIYLPERLHGVRIALKKLRYAVELSAEAGGAAGATADVRALKRGQELLGRLHDLQVLLDRVRQVQMSPMPSDAAARGELDALVDTLEGASRRLHARYVRERPVVLAICDRLGTRMSQPARPAARRVG